MPAELIALIDKPILLLAVLAVGAALGIGVERLVEGQKRDARRAYWAGRNAGKKRGKSDYAKAADALLAGGSNPSGADFAADQLKLVSKAVFTARPLLNRSEAKVFEALDKAVIARNPAWQVMAQVSLGEFLASPDKDAFLAVNSKRVDFALMDEHACVRHALEYQGSGHRLSDCAPARDAVKKEALEKAKIGYFPIVAGHTTPADLRALIEKLVPPSEAGNKPVRGVERPLSEQPH